MTQFFRNVFIVCLALTLALIGAMQARRAFKNAKARRLVAEAALHFKAKDSPQALKCLEAALQANPADIQAIKLTADLLEAGGLPASLGWRVRASELQPANMT